ncbi:hypothetical protein ATKI12_5607 [Kitasatospora sp. Ki12]|uniref:Rv1733c family protein n=1 Tax=Kitasatospora xanthocidica TaxID=83382 RepID=UPI001676BEBA|nr:hypothetical protein [Kitasatospora xanthocidica]GHF54586.1 hypothetical protein GCM10018790_35580 [Kitasatospora xanthocidica]
MSSTPRPARPASLPRRTGRQLRRALGARHEPLARPVDRARARAWLFAVLAAVLVVALSTGGSLLLYRGTATRASAERARLHQVDAVVGGTPERPAAGGGRFTGGYHDRIDVEVTWTAEDGTPRSGTVQAPRSAVTGSTVPVWIDPAGDATPPPLDPLALAVSAACTGLGALLTLLALVVLLLRLRLQALDRRADTAWTDDWARLEPRWSGRAGHRRED